MYSQQNPARKRFHCTVTSSISLQLKSNTTYLGYINTENFHQNTGSMSVKSLKEMTQNAVSDITHTDWAHASSEN